MESSVPTPPLTPPESPIQEETTPQANLIQPESHSRWLILGMALLILILLASTGYLAYQNMQLTNELARIGTIAPTPTPASTIDPTANWETYTISSLAVSFRLPPNFEYDNFSEQIYDGDTGTKSCSTFNQEGDVVGICDIDMFGVGTVSTNYSAGRGGVFTDLLGYVKRDDKYYAKFLREEEFEIPTNLVISEITNTNGMQILLVKGADQTGEIGGPVLGTPGNGKLGALVNNPDNETYPGFVIQMNLTENLDLDVFNQILSTFEFTD